MISLRGPAPCRALKGCCIQTQRASHIRPCRRLSRLGRSSGWFLCPTMTGESVRNSGQEPFSTSFVSFSRRKLSYIITGPGILDVIADSRTCLIHYCAWNVRKSKFALFAPFGLPLDKVPYSHSLPSALSLTNPLRQFSSWYSHHSYYYQDTSYRDFCCHSVVTLKVEPYDKNTFPLFSMDHYILTMWNRQASHFPFSIPSQMIISRYCFCDLSPMSENTALYATKAVRT